MLTWRVWPNSLVQRPPWLYASSVKNKNKTKNNLCLLYVGDVDRAFQLVIASNGLEQTQFLAKSYGKAALHSIQLWKDSHAKDELIHFITTAIERTKWINILFTNFKQFQEFWTNTTLEGFTYKFSRIFWPIIGLWITKPIHYSLHSFRDPNE